MYWKRHSMGWVSSSATVGGARWSAPSFSPDTVTIGDETVTAVTLTNTLTADPAPGLAATGSDPAAGLGPALLLLAAGGAVVLIGRRRRRAS
jgi:hypothetical protein